MDQIDSLERIHLIVSGRVQGVFFRKYTAKTAVKLGLVGWVRNLRDGNVEVYAQGPVANLNKLIEWCHEGPRLARVDRIELERNDDVECAEALSLLMEGRFYVAH